MGITYALPIFNAFLKLEYYYEGDGWTLSEWEEVKKLKSEITALTDASLYDLWYSGMGGHLLRSYLVGSFTLSQLLDAISLTSSLVWNVMDYSLSASYTLIHTGFENIRFSLTFTHIFSPPGEQEFDLYTSDWSLTLFVGVGF